MKYKIVSQNPDLIKKAKHIFNILDMKESIHIQDVDFWLVDVKTIDSTSLLSYKNRISFSHIVFVVNDDEDIRICLQNSFTSYIKADFSKAELIFWCEYFQSQNKKEILYLKNETFLDLQNSKLFFKDEVVTFSKQELTLLKALKKGEFISTKELAKLLDVNSPTSVRTIINRIRKKTPFEIFSQKRDFGYKLNINKEEKIEEKESSHIKELEEQNLLMQEIVDSSPIFIATFIHRQLFCINKAFRLFLGSEIIKELWDEEKGDFFQLLIHSSFEYENLKKELFSIGNHKVSIFDFESKKSEEFDVQTFYFENLDKHLLVFSKV